MTLSSAHWAVPQGLRWSGRSEGWGRVGLEGRGPWGHSGPGHQVSTEPSWRALPTEFAGETQPARSDLAVQQDTSLWYFKKTKPGPFLCLFRWNSQLSWEELVFTYFGRGPIETLGVLPSWNTWRKTSGFDPKKALSKKYVKQTWQRNINIPKIHSMWGKKD